jgi:hypothetical protein
MARYTVQFQKGLSEPGFEHLYGMEEQCRAVVVASRWASARTTPMPYRLVKLAEVYA